MMRPSRQQLHRPAAAPPVAGKADLLPLLCAAPAAVAATSAGGDCRRGFVPGWIWRLVLFRRRRGPDLGWLD